jgi:hypothetical protein
LKTASKSSPVPYRKLRFNSIAEVHQELDKIAELNRTGQLVTSGNWTPGQFIRYILRLRLKQMLQSGMPRGIKIPRVPGGTVGADDMPTDQGIARLRQAFGRLEAREEATYDSPAFGKMSHDDRIRLNLRHAELHLGCLNSSV